MEEQNKNKISEEEQKQLAMVKYRKSNKLVNSRGRTSASVHRLFTVAISEAKLIGNQAVATIPGTKLRAIFQNYTGSFYDVVRRACKSPTNKADLLSWRLEMEDDTTESFSYINVVSSAEFKNGKLTVVFSPEITKEITGLRSNYSEFYRGITLSMKSSCSMILYERLSSQADYLRSTKHNENGPYYVEYDMEELRHIFSLDYTTTEGKKTVKKHLYQRYVDFRVNILEVAKAEINELSPLTIEYEPIMRGRGGKIIGIKFIIERKQKAQTISKEEQTRRKVVFADVSGLLENQNLPIKTIQRICETADYDYDKIKAAYDLSEQQAEIDNFAGWLISAIRDGYQASTTEKKSPGKAAKKTGTKTSKKKKKPQFSDFEQTEYDFDELEEKLTAN